MEIKLKIIESVIFLGNNRHKFFNKLLNNFWNFISCFRLITKINKNSPKPASLLDTSYKFLRKKQFKSTWLSTLKKKKIETVSKKTLRIGDRAVLKENDFILSHKKIIDFYNFFSLLFRKRICKIEIIGYEKETVPSLKKFKAMYYIILIIGKISWEVSKIWLNTLDLNKNLPNKWWRIAKIRESELEFFEHNFVFFSSTAKFKK